MARVKRGVTKSARHKEILKKAKGYRGRRKNTFRIANQAAKKQVNMHILVVNLKSVSSAHFGSNALTLLRVPMARPMAALWTG